MHGLWFTRQFIVYVYNATIGLNKNNVVIMKGSFSRLWGRATSVTEKQIGSLEEND